MRSLSCSKRVIAAKLKCMSSNLSTHAASTRAHVRTRDLLEGLWMAYLRACCGHKVQQGIALGTDLSTALPASAD